MSEDQKTAQELALEAKEKEVKEINDKRSGKGTRVRVGQTRGRNPQIITFEAFDESKPDTLPTSLSEFMELAKTDDEKLIVGYLVDGYNSASYTTASDPIAEFVEASWPEEMQKGFRLAIRSYSVNAGVSVEDAVALLKPGFSAAVAKKSAEAAKPTA